MAVLSGKDGTMQLDGNVVAPLTDWKLDWTTTLKVYAANDTGGAQRRRAGPEDCAGSFHCNLTEAGNCPVAAGDAVVAQFYVDGTLANYYEVPIVIAGVTVDCDIAQGDILAFVVTFNGDGPVTPYGIVAKSG